MSIFILRLIIIKEENKGVKTKETFATNLVGYENDDKQSDVENNL